MSEQELRDYHEGVKPVVLPTFATVKTLGGLGAVTGMGVGAYHTLKDPGLIEKARNLRKVSPISSDSVGDLVKIVKESVPVIAKGLKYGGMAGTALGAAYSANKYVKPDVQHYLANKDMPGAAAASLTKVDPRLPELAGAIAGFHYGGKYLPSVPQALRNKVPFVARPFVALAPTLAATSLGAYAGKATGEAYNKATLNKIVDHYKEASMGNRYLDKIAMETDKSNPVYQKMTAAVDARRQAKADAATANGAAKPAPQSVPNQAPVNHLESSQDKARKIVAAQKEAKKRRGKEYLYRMDEERVSHTPPNMAGSTERVPEYIPRESRPHQAPTDPRKQVSVYNAPAHAEDIHVVPPAAQHTAPHTPIPDPGVQQAESFGEKIMRHLPTSTLGRAALATGGLAVAGGAYGAYHHSKQAEEDNFQPVNPQHKGLLHEEMGVPQGDHISEAQLHHVIATTDNPHTRRRAQFALNARKWRH